MPACVRRHLPLYVGHGVVYPTGWLPYFLIAGTLRPTHQIPAVIFASDSSLCGDCRHIYLRVEYFSPSNSECIFRCFELPLLLFQATRSGDEPFVEVLLLQQLVRCEIVRTVIFVGDGLLIQVVLFGWLFNGMFVIHRFDLLYGWVYMAAVFVEAGLCVALSSPS